MSAPQLGGGCELLEVYGSIWKYMEVCAALRRGAQLWHSFWERIFYKSCSELREDPTPGAVRAHTIIFMVYKCALCLTGARVQISRSVIFCVWVQGFPLARRSFCFVCSLSAAYITDIGYNYLYCTEQPFLRSSECELCLWSWALGARAELRRINASCFRFCSGSLVPLIRCGSLREY